MNHHTTTRFLRELSELDEDALTDCYDLRRDTTLELDSALYAWRDAGCPDAKPSPVTPEDAARGYGVDPDEDDEPLKPTPPEADSFPMTEPLSAQVAAHLRTITAELREAQQRVRELEVAMRRMQDEAAAKGVEIATPTPSASS